MDFKKWDCKWHKAHLEIDPAGLFGEDSTEADEVLGAETEVGDPHGSVISISGRSSDFRFELGQVNDAIEVLLVNVVAAHDTGGVIDRNGIGESSRPFVDEVVRAVVDEVGDVGDIDVIELAEKFVAGLKEESGRRLKANDVIEAF